jgi:hypothetical protein
MVGARTGFIAQGGPDRSSQMLFEKVTIIRDWGDD